MSSLATITVDRTAGTARCTCGWTSDDPNPEDLPVDTGHAPFWLGIFVEQHRLREHGGLATFAFVYAQGVVA